jgi:hypothetical protein
MKNTYARKDIETLSDCLKNYENVIETTGAQVFLSTRQVKSFFPLSYRLSEEEKKEISKYLEKILRKIDKIEKRRWFLNITEIFFK